MKFLNHHRIIKQKSVYRLLFGNLSQPKQLFFQGNTWKLEGITKKELQGNQKKIGAMFLVFFPFDFHEFPYFIFLYFFYFSF